VRGKENLINSRAWRITYFGVMRGKKKQISVRCLTDKRKTGDGGIGKGRKIVRGNIGHFE